MTWQTIFNALSPGKKLAVGLTMGILVYAFFRWLIHLANKDSKNLGLQVSDKRLSQEDKLKRLMAMGSN